MMMSGGASGPNMMRMGMRAQMPSGRVMPGPGEQRLKVEGGRKGKREGEREKVVGEEERERER